MDFLPVCATLWTPDCPPARRSSSRSSWGARCCALALRPQTPCKVLQQRVCCALALRPQMLCNFGLDVLEALSGTCTLWVVGRKGTQHLVADALVAFMIVLLHAVVLMCQVGTWA